MDKDDPGLCISNEGHQLVQASFADIFDGPERLQKQVRRVFTNPWNLLQFIFEHALAPLITMKAYTKTVDFIPDSPDEL